MGNNCEYRQNNEIFKSIENMKIHDRYHEYFTCVIESGGL